MTPPAASATARAGGHGSPEAAPEPRASIWGLAGAAIGWVLWWVLWWPIRTLASALRATAVGAVNRPLRAAVIAAAILLVLAFAYWFWFRNSSYVAIEEIRVEGHTTEIEAINTALAAAAADMTTLNVDEGALEDALARFQTVRGLSVDADLPHRVVITIDEQPPVAVVDWGDRLLTVTGDGRILEGISASQLDVPTIALTEPPGAQGLQGDPLQQALVLGAAPPELRPLIETSALEPTGVVIGVQGGIEIRFGPANDLEEKWTAAVAVLADPKLHMAEYVDVRFPARPVAGGDTELAPVEVTTDPTATAPEPETAAEPTLPGVDGDGLIP